MEAAEKQLEELMGVLGKREELDPDLVPYVDEDAPGFGGPMLRHPLAYIILGNADPETGIYPFAAQANDTYRKKLEMIDKLENEHDWFPILHIMYERPYRLWAFRQYEEHFSDEEFWDLLGGIWTDSENIWQNHDEWLELLRHDRPCREAMMDAEEREYLHQLPETLTIYRGYQRPERQKGCSWTLELERAEWFAKRWGVDEDSGEEARVATATVEKEHVIAYFHGRGEAEIVVLPEHLKIIEDKEVTE